MKIINEALIEAAKNGDKGRLKSLLLRPKCDPVFKNGNGWTALMWAAWNNNATCVSLLLPVSDALAQDNKGSTALMCAAWNGHASCVQLLMPVSDALARDNDGVTALMLAAACGQASCVEVLLPVSDILAWEKHGRTASELARSKGHTVLSDFMDAYTLALGEMSVLSSSITLGSLRKKKSLSV